MAKTKRIDVRVGVRLRIIADKIFGMQKHFASAMSMRSSEISVYINSKMNPGYTFLSKINEIGFSPTWVISGEGEMFAENEAGRKLKEKHSKEEEKDPVEERLEKIEQWIRTQFGSVEKMCDENYYDLRIIKKAFTDRDIKSTKYLYDTLEKEDINYDWFEDQSLPLLQSEADKQATAETITAESIREIIREEVREPILRRIKNIEDKM